MSWLSFFPHLLLKKKYFNQHLHLTWQMTFSRIICIKRGIGWWYGSALGSTAGPQIMSFRLMLSHYHVDEGWGNRPWGVFTFSPCAWVLSSSSGSLPQSSDAHVGELTCLPCCSLSVVCVSVALGRKGVLTRVGFLLVL